jgi:NitT/TauT family transport system substrate-binding protein
MNAAISSVGSPEKPTLNVGAVPAMDSAGFFVALHEGLFSDVGLQINYTPATSSDTVIDQQVQGKFDITAGNYVSYIQHAMQGQQLEVVASGSIMQPGSQVLFAMPGSNIKTIQELQGHTVGVNAPGNIDFLLAKSALSESGINSGVSFPSNAIAFPQMGPDLKSDNVGAAVLPEPFASEAEQQYGAVPVADLDQGATQNFPIEGYVVTKQWATQNPNSLKRFLAALEAGQEIADTDRTAVEQAFETLKGAPNGQVSPAIASVMALNSYPIGNDQAQLQRVSDVMFQFGLESGHKNAYSISSMLLPSGTFNFTPFETSESTTS